MEGAYWPINTPFTKNTLEIVLTTDIGLSAVGGFFVLSKQLFKRLKLYRMETNTIQAKKTVAPPSVINAKVLLDHWQEHRRLTRRVIEAFPEDRFFEYSIGGMRPFSGMIMELIGLATPGIWGVLTGEWEAIDKVLQKEKSDVPDSKEKVLRRWDEVTELLNTLFPQIPASRFQETDRAYGQYESTMYGIILYWIDNEIHHRAQGYVYLRSLGIEPPAFWDRS
jgi:uncharacterized damage-inducible protein DinB